MRRLLPCLALVFINVGPAGAGTFPWGGPPRPSREPHPTVVALRDSTATLRTNLGEITLKFEPDGAPNAVQAFVKLAERGALDGVRFYCVFKDRMIIAGTPPGEKAETIEYENTPQSVTAGTVLLDRTADGQNCPSRFLIVLADQRHLDGDFTQIGEVTKGLDVAKRIGSMATRPSDGSPAPLEDAVIEQATVARKATPEPKETKKK
ncbi:MAG: peptidylprolyl isomerase [Planctomycetes bacterium]|nr:peptidylprolyl isomerase [Planctomycetota bacterium]